MDRENKDEVLIRAYLLGELSQAEQEEMEQRFMTQGDCFDLALAVEEELVDQYLYGNLSKEAQRQLSRRFLATREGAEQLQFAANLKEWARHKHTDREREPSAGGRAGRWLHALLRLRGRSAAVRYAFVATPVFLATILLLGLQVWRLQDQVKQLLASQMSPTPLEQELQEELARQQAQLDDEARSLQQLAEERDRLAQEVRRLNGSGEDRPQPLIAALTLPPGRARGSGGSHLLVIKQGTGQVRLHLLVREPAYASYQVSLQEESGKPVWTADSLKPQIAGGRIQIDIRLPAQLLSGGDYWLRLSGRTDQAGLEEAGNYYFRIARE
jgi:hypothetical protein